MPKSSQQGNPPGAVESVDKLHPTPNSPKKNKGASVVKTNTYLLFNGNCQEAFKFYEKCFGGKIDSIMTYDESPMTDSVPANWRDKIIHVTMNLGNHVLMGSDAPPERYQKPQGFSVNIAVDSVTEAESVFQSLEEGGTVRMPLQQTFWAERYAMLIDRFGIPWMINCEKAG
jgi:PhnB protein